MITLLSLNFLILFPLYLLSLSLPTNSNNNDPSLAYNSISPPEREQFQSYRIPETAIIRNKDAMLATRKIRPTSKLDTLKAKAKRVIGLKLSLGNIGLNTTEIWSSGVTPILVFVNRKSGGKLGDMLLNALRSILNEVQICDVTTSKPSEYLSLFSQCKKNMRIICCGGDGTVSW